MSAEGDKIRQELEAKSEEIARRLMGKDYREGIGAFLSQNAYVAWTGALEALEKADGTPRSPGTAEMYTIAIIVAGLVAREHAQVPAKDLAYYMELAQAIHSHVHRIYAVEKDAMPEYPSGGAPAAKA